MTQITNVTWTIWRHQRSTSVRTVTATSASGTILSTPPSLTAWHAPDHTGLLVLRQGVGSGVTHLLRPPRPIVAHAGEQHTHGIGPNVLRSEPQTSPLLASKALLMSACPQPM
jgi:hypothetical protein